MPRLSMDTISFDCLVQSLYLNHGMSSLNIAPIVENSKQSVLRSLARSNISRRPNTVANRIYSQDNQFFSVIDSEVKAYWLGFIAADGCVYRTSGGLQSTLKITLHIKDCGHLEQFATDIRSSSWPSLDRGQITFSVYGKDIVEDLLNLGITQRKTHTLKPPQAIPSHLIRHFIRGYIDGDGCFYRHRTSNRTIDRDYVCLGLEVLGTKEILEFIAGNLSQVMSNPLRLGISKNIWRARITLGATRKTDIHALYRYLYDDATRYLERKRRIINEFI